MARFLTLPSGHGAGAVLVLTHAEADALLVIVRRGHPEDISVFKEVLPSPASRTAFQRAFDALQRAVRPGCSFPAAT